MFGDEKGIWDDFGVKMIGVDASNNRIREDKRAVQTIASKN